MIEEILDADLLKEQAEHDKRERSGKFTPSALGQCFRRQIWKRRGVEETDKPGVEKLRIFRAGKLFHKMVQNLLPAHQTEVEINDEDIKGFADIVMDDTVVDIKSQNQWAFKLMDKPGFDIETEKSDHIKQVCMYAWKLGKPKAMLIYINKDNLETREFEFVVEEWIPKIEQELKVLRGLWKDEGDPIAQPRLYKSKEGILQECIYCQFLTKCKGRKF